MINVENLSKFYGGKRALGPVSFEIENGETVGFLGLNGAGKTTALRILACDLRPSGGTVAVDGVDALANPHQVRQRIGFLPEFPPLYQDMIVTDYLQFAGRLRGMSTSAVNKRLPKVMELTHITDVQNEVIGHLSHGYRQRVGVAQAIVHEPTLLILDEPTRGLDPVQIVEMRNMINALKVSHTVLISSHILTEISQTCDRLLVLGKGEIVAAGPEQELAERMLHSHKIVAVVRLQGPGQTDGKDDADADAGADPVARCIEAVDGVSRVTPTNSERDNARVYEIQCTDDVRSAISRAVIQAGHDLIKLDYGHGDLERTFLELVKGGSADAND